MKYMCSMLEATEHPALWSILPAKDKVFGTLALSVLVDSAVECAKFYLVADKCFCALSQAKHALECSLMTFQLKKQCILLSCRYCVFQNHISYAGEMTQSAKHYHST